MPFIAIPIVLLVALFAGRKNNFLPKRTEQQEQDDELISVILPTINHDK